MCLPLLPKISSKLVKELHILCSNEQTGKLNDTSSWLNLQLVLSLR
jgi:hypothetical protein